jgi:hypothetical protein
MTRKCTVQHLQRPISELEVEPLDEERDFFTEGERSCIRHNDEKGSSKSSDVRGLGFFCLVRCSSCCRGTHIVVLVYIKIISTHE